MKTSSKASTLHRSLFFPVLATWLVCVLSTLALAAPVVHIALSVGMEDNKKQLKATVTADEKPVEGATVTFAAKRLLGMLPLGEDKTLDDGSAAIAFPSDLPGGPTGELNIVATIKDPANLAGAKVEQTLSGGFVLKDDDTPYPAALWARRAPLSLRLIVAAIVLGVWGTYLVVVRQLMLIYKGGRL